MKKIIAISVVLACGVMLAACGNDKDTASSSSSAESSSPVSTQTKESASAATASESSTQGGVTVEQSGTTEEAGEQASATTPEVVRGSWTATNNEGQTIDLTITDNQLTTNGTTYDITSFDQVGNQYTLFWDDSNIEPGVNPQAFMYTYLPDTDQLDGGLIFSRK